VSLVSGFLAARMDGGESMRMIRCSVVPDKLVGPLPDFEAK